MRGHYIGRTVPPFSNSTIPFQTALLLYFYRASLMKIDYKFQEVSYTPKCKSIRTLVPETILVRSNQRSVTNVLDCKSSLVKMLLIN